MRHIYQMQRYLFYLNEINNSLINIKGYHLMQFLYFDQREDSKSVLVCPKHKLPPPVIGYHPIPLPLRGGVTVLRMYGM